MMEFRETRLNEIITDVCLDPNDAMHGWIVLIDGMLMVKSKGQFIFKDRSAAVRALYSEMNWRITDRRQNVLMYPPDFRAMSWRERQAFNSKVWSEWKKYMGDRIKIKQV